MSHVKYKERQDFSRPDVLIVLGIFIAVGVFRLTQEFFRANPNEVRMLILVGSILLFGALFYYLKRVTLTTRFNEKNIKFKLSPFGWRKGKIKWSEVVNAEIMELPPAFVWSGWNVHFASRNKLINLDGEVILHLKLKSGQEVSIGCNDRTQLESFFNNAKALHPNLADISLS